jgi:hypothetical protein
VDLLNSPTGRCRLVGDYKLTRTLVLATKGIHVT